VIPKLPSNFQCFGRVSTESFPKELYSLHGFFLFMAQFWEHVNKVIEEVHRISKHGAVIIMNAPHFSCWSAWGDITHKRPFNSTSLEHVNIKRKKHGSLLLKNNTFFSIEKKTLFIRRLSPNMALPSDVTKYSRRLLFEP